MRAISKLRASSGPSFPDKRGSTVYVQCERYTYRFCFVPEFCISDELLWPGRQSQLVGEAKNVINMPQEVQTSSYLVRNLDVQRGEKNTIKILGPYRSCVRQWRFPPFTYLVKCAEDVSVILLESSDSCETR